MRCWSSLSIVYTETTLIVSRNFWIWKPSDVISIVFEQICDVASAWGRHLWQCRSRATCGHWREGGEQLNIKSLNISLRWQLRG